MSDTYGQPMLVEPPGAAGGQGRTNTSAFARIPLEDPSLNENWLQRLLFQHPELIPIGDTDQLFAPLKSLAREVPTPVGPVDLLCVSPAGFLTIVETKLHRNPQSRREVLGQILDYCARMSKWSYDDLVSAVSASRHRANDAPDPVLSAALGDTSSITERQRFRSNVSECLRHGRFMMVIVGDAFRESTTALLEHVQASMHLQFTLRLVELTLYRDSRNAGADVLVVPRLAARTQEVTRAIVRILPAVDPAHVTVEGVKEETSPGLESFLELLRRTTQVADEFASLTGELSALGVYVDPTKDGLALRYADPIGSHQQFRVFRARNNGNARFGVLASQLEKLGRSPEPALRFSRAIAAWIPGSTVGANGAVCGADGTTRDVPLELLVKTRRDDFLTAVRRLLSDLASTEP